jgi:hypothetical protein
MSYYKYAERSAQSRVDWSEISKNMVDMLKEQTRLRNEKLDDAVKLQGEVTTTLSDAPMGSDTNANQRVSEFAADAQEYSLMMNKLWRSGEMSYREYMAATNNFKTNTEGYLGQAEKYAANYEKHVKRMEEQLASGVEVSELARVEDFGNFSKFTPVIDAPTGSIGLVGEDGRKFASVSQLGVAVMTTYDRLDVAGMTSQAVDQLGEITQVVLDGRVETRTGLITPRDADGNPIGELTEYEKTEDEIVGGILDTSDNAATSTLVDYSNLSYESHHLDSADDIQAAVDDPKLVVMMPSPRNSDRFIGAVEDDVTDADFEAYLDQRGVTPEQKEALIANRKAQKDKAFDLVRNSIRRGLNVTETAQDQPTYRPPSAEVIKLQEAARERSSDLGDWMEMLTGDRDRQDALANSLTQTESAKDAGIVKIDPTDPQDIILHIDTNGDGVGDITRPVRRIAVGEDPDGIATSLRDWARMGRIIHGVGGDESDAILDARNLTGTVTTPEGEVVEDAELVTASREAPLEPGGNQVPIQNFQTGSITFTTVDDKGNTKEVTDRPAVYFDRSVTLERSSDEANDKAVRIAREIVQRSSDNRLDADYITRINAEKVDEEMVGMPNTDVISFYIPEVMDAELYIPTESSQAKTMLADILELAMARAEDGERISLDELMKFYESYGDEDVVEFNEKMPGLFGIESAPRQRSRTEDPIGPVPVFDPNNP